MTFEGLKEKSWQEFFTDMFYFLLGAEAVGLALNVMLSIVDITRWLR